MRHAPLSELEVAEDLEALKDCGASPAMSREWWRCHPFPVAANREWIGKAGGPRVFLSLQARFGWRLAWH